MFLASGTYTRAEIAFFASVLLELLITASASLELSHTWDIWVPFLIYRKVTYKSMTWIEARLK